MNTYDPMDAIANRHMTRDNAPHVMPVSRGRTCTRLPTGYANKALKTRLRGVSCA